MMMSSFWILFGEEALKGNLNWYSKFKVGFRLPWSLFASQTGILTFKVFGVVPDNFTVEWFAAVTKSFWCLAFMQKIQFLQCGLHEAMIISWIIETAQGWIVTLLDISPQNLSMTHLYDCSELLIKWKCFFSWNDAKFTPDFLYIMLLWHFRSLPNGAIWNENKFSLLIFCEPLEIAFKCRM